MKLNCPKCNASIFRLTVTVDDKESCPICGFTETLDYWVRIETFQNKGNITLEDAKKLVGIGWHKILEDMYSKFNNEIFVETIKEKFGTLRVYVYDANQEAQEAIEKAEVLSETTCEACGEKGKLKDKNGWLKTLCEKH